MPVFCLSVYFLSTKLIHVSVIRFRFLRAEKGKVQLVVGSKITVIYAVHVESRSPNCAFFMYKQSSKCFTFQDISLTDLYKHSTAQQTMNLRRRTMWKRGRGNAREAETKDKERDMTESDLIVQIILGLLLTALHIWSHEYRDRKCVVLCTYVYSYCIVLSRAFICHKYNVKMLLFKEI